MLAFADVTDLNDFYRGSLPEILRIKALITNLRLLYSLAPNRISLQVAEGERVYKIILKDSKKNVFGWLIYRPLDKILELYDSGAPDISVPLLAWKNKKVIVENYYTTLVLAGISKTFDRLVSAL